MTVLQPAAGPMRRVVFFLTALATAVVGLSTLPAAGDDKQRNAMIMTNQRLETLIRRLDKDAKGRPGFWQFTIEQRPLLVITDEKADRMRIMTPVVDTAELDDGVLTRLMQANFDTALDARYAIAQGKLWSAFIHPLGALTEDEFIAGIGQVVNLAATYGTSYSSGLLIFRGGDSDELRNRELIERLKKKARTI